MDMTSLQGPTTLTNVFEKSVGEYAKSGYEVSLSDEDF